MQIGGGRHDHEQPDLDARVLEKLMRELPQQSQELLNRRQAG
jgi:hypothetical protein